MTQQLRGMAVTTVQELRSFSEVELVREFGATSGHMLAQLALYAPSSAAAAFVVRDCCMVMCRAPGKVFKITSFGRVKSLFLGTVTTQKPLSKVRVVCRGKDDSAVVASGAPKAITCEDSFKSCSSFDAVATVVRP